VTGNKTVEIRSAAAAMGVNTLPMGLVKKKRKGGPGEATDAAPSMPLDTAPKVNVLSAGVIRKKAKT